MKSGDIEFDWYINLFKDKESFEFVSKPFLEDYFKSIKFLDELD